MIIVTALLAVLSNIYFVRTSCIDPGILPKFVSHNSNDCFCFVERQRLVCNESPLDQGANEIKQIEFSWVENPLHGA